jgi:hypothetical protein
MKTKVLGLVALGLLAGPMTAQSAILQVDGAGILTGATQVDVGGALYDVHFVDGTCAAAFGACDAAHLTFNSQAAAQAAANALLSSVFVGQFDTNPGKILGCTATFCDIQTPYLIQFIPPDAPAPTGVLVALAHNCNESDAWCPDSVDGAYGFNINADTALSPSRVWAVWNSSVPEPGTFAQLGLGLAGLGITRRRNKAN